MRPWGLDDRHRRSIRLRGYDYASYGAYFVTMCVQGRLPLLGAVVGGEVRLTPAGEMVRELWATVSHLYEGVSGDATVIMPNHMHAIVLLRESPVSPDVMAATLSAPRTGCLIGPGDGGVPGQGDAMPGQGQSPAPTFGDGDNDGAVAGGLPQTTVGDVVRRFKTYTTRLYGEGVRLHEWPAYEGRLWQRNYYEHIIRNEQELVAIRAYIQNNPAQWAMDRENPGRL